MTNEKAIMNLESWQIDLPTNSLQFEVFEKAIKALKVESCKKETEYGWIPVSERLPSHDEYIKNNGLFNVSDGNRSYSEWFDIYETKMFGEPTINGFRVDCAVTAWMPLPETYKAESEEV